MNYYDENFNDLAKYCGTLKNGKGLSREKERELALKIQQGDNKALNELVEANLKYVVTIAKKFAWTGLPLYDLISEGNLGLIRQGNEIHNMCETLDYPGDTIVYTEQQYRQGVHQC